MSTQRLVVTHRRAHPVLGFLGVLVVVGAVIHFWYVVLAVVTVVVAIRVERRRRIAAEVQARRVRDRQSVENYRLRQVLTRDDRAWLGSHGWTA